MSEQHLITREIGIDMGHRVTHHGSKCRNLHGHRYTIQATCSGPLFVEGEQQGMVLDFGFLKEEMMNEIDDPCDHGMCLWIEDPFVDILAGDATFHRRMIEQKGYSQITKVVGLPGGATTGGKFYIVPFVPTAENLARHWFQRLAPQVVKRSEGYATLSSLKVWETPNCSAQYPTVGFFGGANV